MNYIEKNILNYPDYCILNLCRLIYSFKTKDVVISKAQASDWAYNNLVNWRKLIELAKKSYEHMILQDERQLMITGVREFLEFAKMSISKLSKGD